MDASCLDAFVDALIDDLAPVPPEGDVGPRLGRLVDCPRPVVDDEALLGVLAAAVSARNLLDFVIASAVVAAERAGVPGRRHLCTGADVLRLLGMAPGAAARAVRVGRAASSLPALTTAQRLGGIGIEFADAVGKGVAHVESRTPLSDEERATVVRALMVQTSPAEVAAKARAIAIDRGASLAPADRVVPVAENATLNEMTLVQNAEGRFEATLDLDVGTGEELCAALDPLCRPVPLPDGSPDPRSVDARRAEALGQVLRTYLSQSRRPMSGGVLPHVTLIRPVAPGVTAGNSGEVVDRLGFGGPISAATAELIACDSTLTSVIVDHAGVPLDVGRAQRLFTPAIRKALAVRDGGCAHPGCGRPVSWCDAHHIHPWSAGGATSVDNGVLLCRLHQSLIHHGGWQVYLGPDRHPWFIPPHTPEGAEPEHLRSHTRRTMTDLPTAA
ncbi:HNH endonuclease signature motif containing protein [Arthrobacter sp. SLBN-53]|uniref:HNH endonuclease signature motif containing protein n=1 Tax=Arthrobacter sp. SLBN-53 TaxID=2768412 RepID=UPI00114D5E25|nr:HNH endonuclease signature motif containing protein [Arthrobacter sp. SLBN-53]TQK29177.1 HNH endonuclease [Arthrobacter sp. SLBN-53]